ncbi:MAG: polysaccharide pyruvyl transferase family protein [Bacteroidales bacterium]|nr:polysaccharide pyruvyl transferase family protein [Bacteroidales bacterium]
MKIGLLTYHSVYNFGASLQLFSTISYLRKKGHEPVVINWVPHDLEKRYDSSIPEEQAMAHREFAKKNFRLTELCRTAAEVAEAVEKNKIEFIITGSDAVLQHSTLLSRLTMTSRGPVLRKKPGSDVLYPNPFWGSFIPLLKKEIPVVIMSASSQNTRYGLIRGKQRKEMAEALNRFSMVTVRDEWTRAMVRYLSYSKIRPEKTPDPVFAYNSNVDNGLTEQKLRDRFNLPGKYLLVSFRTKRCISAVWMERLKKIAGENNMECVALAMPDGIKFENNFNKSIDLPLNPEDWYALIRYSAGYIGENMHPVVVALHNGVPFYTFDSYGIVRFKFHVVGRSSKIYDILADAGLLQNRSGILSRAYKMPDPQYVMDRITGFDIEACKRFSLERQDKYEEMMERILNLKE